MYQVKKIYFYWYVKQKEYFDFFSFTTSAEVNLGFDDLIIVEGNDRIKS